MKYYVREIKPYIQMSLPGCDAGYSVDAFDWVPEDREEELRNTIEVDPAWAVLIFKERFVEVRNG